MNETTPGSPFASATQVAAEEVLRVIYGDDLEGCAVTVNEVAGAIGGAFQPQADYENALSELHQKGFEAIQLLSTPPPDGAGLSPEELRTLLSERLDSIHVLTKKILSTTAAAKAKASADAARS
ncbi:MAG TPA: hypothetical protein VGO90_08170 [Chthoniobacteraceae bacterium]|jgi:hypothetical protein|nr:hypothetical protein [Chthoniobacter sp.]HEV7867643.1 hypothetical protein [Chthoniobacteraceae bacterium]